VERPIDIGVAPRAFNKAAINQVEVPQEQNLRRVVRSVLRNNPDVLVIGEIPGRDRKLWQLAVDAAASGTLVLVSVRRSGAVAALEQCVESFRAADRASIRGQLAATVLAVVGQKLLPSQDGDGRVLVDELILPAKAGIREMISRGEFEMIRCVVQEHKEGLRSIDAGLIALAEDGRISRADALEVAHHAHIVKARLQRVASSK
jgi:twitching motility protein PilT